MPGLRPLCLDGLTVCEGGLVMNHVFRLESGSQPVEYRGEMVKRAPPDPDDFLVVAPAESCRTKVDLAPLYALPETGRLDFSPDEGFFVSNILELDL